MDTEQLPGDDVGGLVENLAANGSSLWPTPFVNVCWATAGFDTEKRWVREAVENSWVRYSRVVFAGWGMCTNTTSSGIHILLEQGAKPVGGVALYGWPRVTWLGRASSGGFAGTNDMRLSFDFVAAAKLAPSFMTNCQASAANREACIRSIAAHEFGHALGFAHEQDRSDTSVECVSSMPADSPAGAIPNELLLGQFNGNSIMSYCTTGGFNNNGILTPNDIWGVQRAYGKKTAGNLVSFDGRCLDFSGGNTNGSLAQTYECLGGTQFAPGNVASANQRMYFVPSASKLGLFNTNRVLDVPNNNPFTGNRLQLFDSLNTTGQRWTMPNAVLRGMGEMCAGNVQAGAGSELGLQVCNDLSAAGAGQRFDIRADGTFVNRGAGLCLQATGGSGTRLQLQNCNGQANQRWTLTANGTITSALNNLCVDMGIANDRFFGTNNVHRLQLFNCNNTANQQFSLGGPIVGLANKCVDVAAFGRANGTSVQLWDCNNLANQNWELYW